MQSLSFWICATVVLWSTQIIAVRKIGRGAEWLVAAIWFAGWVIVDTLLDWGVLPKVINLGFAILCYWLWHKIGPKNKFRRLKKVAGERIRLLIVAMTAVCKPKTIG